MQNQDRSRYLDVIRGLAILSVILVHTGSKVDWLTQFSGGVPPTIIAVTDLGRFGVQLFFVLSGWLLQDLYGASNSKFQTRTFIVRRFARIFPLWIVFLCLGFWLPNIGLETGVGDILKSVSPDHRLGFAILIIFMAVTFTLWIFPLFWNTVIPGGWSIQAEVGHYLVFPLIRNLSVTGLIYFLAGVRLATDVAYFAARTIPDSGFAVAVTSWIRLGLFSSLLFFVAGMLISRWKSSNWVISRWHLLGLFILWFSLLVNADSYGDELQKIGFIAVALAAAKAIGKWRLLENWMATVGKYSYFMYFCHFIALDIAGKLVIYSGLLALAHNSKLFTVSLIPIVFLFALAMSLALGVLSWKVIENPIIRWARSI
jgi:peptidoglycan/LPS O-acetylase OafA/YrhL